MHSLVRLSTVAAAALLALSSSSCVSQQKYGELADQVRILQDSNNDYLVFTDEQQARIEELQSQLERFGESGMQPAAVDGMSESEITEALANMPTDPLIDEKMDELSRLALSLSGSGEVTPIPVVGGYGFSLTDSVLFDSGSATVKPEGRELLLELCGDIAQKPYERVWVRGHTDSVPVSRPETLARFPNGNLELSAERALQVASLLSREGGLPIERLVAAGFGSGLPIADNGTPEGKRMNRRVEIFVIEDSAEAEPDAGSR